MFRHQGNRRTYLHNIRLASILSFVAGMVNVYGILSIRVLTTNVTGHFAFFAEEMSHSYFSAAVVFMFYILCFLLGAFVSNLMVEFSLLKHFQAPHIPPLLLEILLLIIVTLWPDNYAKPELIGCVLLFAMGLQNALVTKISKATVRTTHLTGLFTDLGIELSQLFFYRKQEERKQLLNSVGLRLTIILFFFLGGAIAGLLFPALGSKSLLLACFFLIVALFYDIVRLKFYLFRRKWH